MIGVKQGRNRLLSECYTRDGSLWIIVCSSVLMVVVPALMAFSGQSSEGDADSGADSYVPAAVFCANGSETFAA